MKTVTLFVAVFFAIILSSFSQSKIKMDYEPNKHFPFGRYNPEAPEQLKDFQELIGLCDCKSETRNQDRTWAKPINMTWKWKYIMNGTAVQDETLKEDGGHSGSIRQYSKDSMRWNVHYYSNKGVVNTLPVWNGNKKDDGKIVLYRDQKAPNGMEGYFRLTFYDINPKGYKWIGEWVNKAETFSYPTWKIACTKRED